MCQSQKRTTLNVDDRPPSRSHANNDVINDVMVATDRKRKSAGSRVRWGRDVLLANHCGPAAPAARCRRLSPGTDDVDVDQLGCTADSTSSASLYLHSTDDQLLAQSTEPRA